MKAAALGNAMEWFDFGVYSYIAVTLGKVFFPRATPPRSCCPRSARSPRPSWSARSAAWSSVRSATAWAGRRSSPSR
ncbi:hypothetical protein ACFQV4_06740 [Streptomyces thermocarboxydus]